MFALWCSHVKKATWVWISLITSFSVWLEQAETGIWCTTRTKNTFSCQLLQGQFKKGMWGFKGFIWIHRGNRNTTLKTAVSITFTYKQLRGHYSSFQSTFCVHVLFFPLVADVLMVCVTMQQKTRPPFWAPAVKVWRSQHGWPTETKRKKLNLGE